MRRTKNPPATSKTPTPSVSKVAPSIPVFVNPCPVCARAGAALTIVIASIAANNIDFFNFRLSL